MKPFDREVIINRIKWYVRILYKNVEWMREKQKLMKMFVLYLHVIWKMM